MKQVPFLIFSLCLMFSGTALVNAQVRVGQNTAPEHGAVLDLNGAPNIPGGLLLPNVNITNLDLIPANFSDATVAGLDKVPALTGLTVWNTNINIGEGVYVWDGDKWSLWRERTYCEGAIIANGAYFGPADGTALTGFSGSFVAGWTDNIYTPKYQRLCWDSSDKLDQTGIGNILNWSVASTVCQTPWRLPNLKELQVLYEALGGNGGAATDFTVLRQPNSNAGSSNFAMSGLSYWSNLRDPGTGTGIVGNYKFNFGTGERMDVSDGNSGYVRCVRDILK